jgi:uncharacterized protein
VSRTSDRSAAPHLAFRLLRIAILGYLAVALMLFFLQSRMVYFPTRAIEATPADVGLAYQDAWMTTDDGVRLHGWWVPHEEARGAVLFLHGNAGNISHRLGTLQTLHRLGLSTLIPDYRGYGRSEGRPSETGTYRDAAAAWGYLTDTLEVPPDRIVLFGRSLGGAVAAERAEHGGAAGLILESTFTSVPDLGAEIYPWLPVRLLARIRYPTLARMPSLTLPVLVVHSREDEIIPYAHGRRLWEAAPGPKWFLDIEGGHNDGHLRSEVRYEAGLAQFLDRVLPPPAR